MKQSKNRISFLVFLYFFNQKAQSIVIGEVITGQIGIFNSTSQYSVKTIQAHSNHTWRIRKSPFYVANTNVTYVATSSIDQTVKVWNTFDWTLVQTYSQHSSFVIDFDWLSADMIEFHG